MDSTRVPPGLNQEPARYRLPWIQIFGWYGIAAILLAFFLSSHHILPVGVIYHLLNITGAIGVVLVSLKKRAWQAAMLGAIWAYIAFSAIRS